MKERFSELFRFSDWSSNSIPKVAAGVYAIWRDNRLIYCGMSGRSISTRVQDQSAKPYGLVTRLKSHASGRLSGDQFCVYVANRLILPTLEPTRLAEFEDGTLTLDQLTKDFILKHLSYQYVVLADEKVSMQVEVQCRRGDVWGQKPLLNPIA